MAVHIKEQEKKEAFAFPQLCLILTDKFMYPAAQVFLHWR